VQTRLRRKGLFKEKGFEFRVKVMHRPNNTSPIPIS